MTGHPLKILLMGDASNFHATLAEGLRRLGHDVTVASHGSRWMDTTRQIDISRRDGKLGGAILWLKLNTTLAPRFKGYDIVNLVSPGFIEQRPQRIIKYFDFLKRNNRHVFMTALGTDTFYVDMCLAADSPLRYNEWRIAREPSPYAIANSGDLTAWQGTQLRDLADHVYGGIEGVVSALIEYHYSIERVLAPELIAYGGIPIDTQEVKFTPLNLGESDKINIFAACHAGRMVQKGMDMLDSVCRQLARDFPDKINYEMVSNIPYAEFVKKLDEAHIVVDQLYSYTPATTALLAMAKGKVVVSGGEPEYYDFIGEPRLRPIVNPDPLNPEGIYSLLKALIHNPSELNRLSREGREFVERHNSAETVATRFVEFWKSRM